ncbi:MAG: peptidoglycan-binding domain-containing protein [Patescibacteria group bacterium]
MSNNIKKFSAVALSITTAVWLFGAVAIMPASAQTVGDLQAQISALLAQIQALQQQLGQAQQASPSYSFTKSLTIGATGDDVKALQQFLNSKGFTVATSGAGSVGNESTYFGSKTAAALAKYQASVGISPAVGYFGSITRNYVNSLAAAPTTPTTPTTPTVPGTGLALALASDNPAMTVLPAGATGVTMMKFTVSGSGTLDGITFKRVGLGATADFAASGFYLYDGNTRLTTGRSINSTTHEVNFLNLALAVSGTKTLSLVANVATGASSGNIDAFQLVSSIGTPTPSGTLMSNYMTIATAAVGTITIDDAAAPTNPKIGQTNAKFGEFTIQAGAAEDIEIRRLGFTEGGSVSNANLSNFKLVQAGNTIATVSAVGSKDLITFELATPFALEKGQQRTFEVYGDVSGATRTSDTIILYIDNAADIYAVGKTYGYAVTPTIANIDSTSEADTLTIAGGQVTITFNGPVTGDIVVRGQDVEVYNFTIASQNNVEIRNLRLHATTTNLGSGEAFNDFKVWDVTAGGVVTSAADITTSTDQTFTDVININAGQSKTYKVTVDVDSDNDNNDTVLVSLLAFQSGDIRNLDNNTNVATSDIVPSSTISGNTLTVRVPTVDVQLSATPSSQTLVRGTNDVALVGLSFRATNDIVKLSSVRVTATSTSGTLTNAEITSLGLYDGATLISEKKSLDATALNATFSNLNITIAKGATKVLTVKGNIDSNATNGDVYYVYLASAGTNDITVYDKDGNTATITGTSANSGNTVVATVTDVGAVSVVKASDDSDSETGLVVAGQDQTLAKFRFTATNENMKVNKMQLLVVATNSATATSTASADEVPSVKLYDGATLVGNAPVTASGDNAGTAFFTDLNWTIPKDTSRTLTVMGALNTTAGGADTGASVYASVMADGFEAAGATSLDTTLTAATGNQMVVYKTRPTFGAVAAGSSKLTAGLIPTLKFKIKADLAEQVAWKQIQFKATVTGASITAVDANPAQTGNVYIKRVGAASNLNIATAFSSTSTTTDERVGLGNASGQTGYISLLLNSEEVITAGAEQEYELGLTFSGISGTVGASTVVLNLHRTETTLVNATTVTGVRGSIGSANDAAPSFVWSDYSNTSHSESTTDWANAVLIKGLPTSPVTLSNN